jgi:glycosyltransferase involved in cell wall biosynthesis
MAQASIVFGPLPPPYGGVGVFMSSLKDAAFGHGAEVWSYAGDGGDARVRTVDHRRFGHIRSLMRLGKGSRIVDSSHFHLEYPHRLLLPAWLQLKKQKQFTWIKACHDGSLPFRYAGMTDSQKRRMAKALAAIDILVVSSPDLVDFFSDKHDRPVRYISPLLPDEQAYLKNDRSGLDGVKRVLSIGAFIPSYGFHEAAEAVEKLRNDGTEITLTLLDGGFARDEDYRRRVVADRPWIVVRELVPHAEVARYLSDADVFVRSFAHESYGLSRVEAILAGVPVIATDIGETRGMLTYHSGDVTKLVEHLKTTLADAAPDLTKVARMYRDEAAANLAAYVQLLTGDANA